MVLLGMQIAKCFGGYLLRVNTALATQGPLLQQKAFVETFYGPNHFLSGVSLKKSRPNPIITNSQALHCLQLYYCFFRYPLNKWAT